MESSKMNEEDKEQYNNMHCKEIQMFSDIKLIEL